MKILVTGSEGSLMQRVIPKLIEQSHSIIGVDNFVRYGNIKRERDYEFVEGDLIDRQFVFSLMQGVDYVIQSAARIYGIGGFNSVPADILSHDVNLHQNVLWAAVKYGIKKVVFISSSMVYERCGKYPCSEEDAMESLIPSTDYGLSKVVNERLSRSFFRQYNLPYTIWRPFNIITPFEESEGDQGTSHVFADFIKAIVDDKSRHVPLIGSGNQIRCFTWIEEVANAIAKNLCSYSSTNETFNLGNPEPVTMKQLAVIIFKEAQNLELLPKTCEELSFRTLKSYDSDVVVRIPGVKKASDYLQWNAKVTLVEAIRKCLKKEF